MPELPEVETIRLQLEKSVVGKKIAKVEVLHPKSFIGNPRVLLGKKIVGVKRRAKILIFELDNSTSGVAKYFLLVHLKLTGQLIYKLKIAIKNSKLSKSKFDVDVLPNKFTRVIITFDDNSHLYFNDMRLFGWMKVKEKGKRKKEKVSLDEIIGERFGPEPLSKDFTLDYLREILSNWGRPVKLLLMDQKKIAGIGNIYANEALFCAGIAPHHRGRELVRDHPEKVEKLFGCIKKVLEAGLKYGGATVEDDAYRNLEGERGRMQEHLKIYRKEDQPCPNKCGGIIRRMTLQGRGTFFCPRCQR